MCLLGSSMYISGVSIKTIFVCRIADSVSIPKVENAVYIRVLKRWSLQSLQAGIVVKKL